MNDPKVNPVEAQAVPDQPVAWRFRCLGEGLDWLISEKQPRSDWFDVEPLFTRPTPAAADLTYWKACESQNLDLLAAIGYPHERDTMVSPEEYAAELKRKADAFHLAGDEAGRTSVEAAANAPSADGSAQIVNLLRLILERLPDPSAPLGEAIEWESNDGCDRTTDPDMARNWAAAIGVTVVRRAPTVAQPVNNSGASGSPARTDDGQVNKEKPHD